MFEKLRIITCSKEAIAEIDAAEKRIEELEKENCIFLLAQSRKHQRSIIDDERMLRAQSTGIGAACVHVENEFLQKQAAELLAEKKDCQFENVQLKARVKELEEKNQMGHPPHIVCKILK